MGILPQNITNSSWGEGEPKLIATLPPDEEHACAFFVEWRTEVRESRECHVTLIHAYRSLRWRVQRLRVVPLAKSSPSWR